MSNGFIPNPTKDYLVSLEFAKHIAMMARTEKAHEYRNHLTNEQKRCILALQRANTIYLLEGVEFDLRKKRLSSLYERQHAKPLLEELIRLES